MTCHSMQRQSEENAMKRIILFPVVLILKLIRLIVNKISELYAMVGIWLWALVIVGIIYTVVHQQWSQVVLFVIIGTVSFGILFLAVILESIIEGIERSLC